MHGPLYTIVRRANPVAWVLWSKGSRRELFRGILSPEEGETVSVALMSHAFEWLTTVPVFKAITMAVRFIIFKQTLSEV